MRARRRWAAAALVLLAPPLASCNADTGDRPSDRAPWDDRPVVDLRFDVAEDLETVAGRERVLFTPDQPTCELVFRAWPNKPATSRAGNSLVVSEVRVGGRVAAVEDIPAGAPASAPAGTLLEVPLSECAEAGDQLEVELDFDLVLGEDADERMGTSGRGEVAWFATAFPLLAWERGSGWNRTPAVPVRGEMAVSEDFLLDSLEVVAPSGFEVVGTGTAEGTSDGPDEGTTIHRFTASAVRDVAVSVGELDVLEREIDGIRVHVATDQAVERAAPSDWLDQIEASLGPLIDLLGRFPYPDLWVTVLSAQTSGVEFPGAIQFGDTDPAERRRLVTHELAHMWFYGLVGNDQGGDPWLDEAFTTLAQAVADGQNLPYPADISPEARGNVGRPITYWADFPRASSLYVQAVYTAGGAALAEARERAGEDEFDTALRDYLSRNAHTVATPEDVETAFADLPDALEVLRDAGALP